MSSETNTFGLKTIISTEKAPAAIWSYSQAIKIWNTLYSSWQIALDSVTMHVVDWWIKEQTIQVCKNLWEVLREAWMDYRDVVKTTIFLDNMDDFKSVNEVYSEYFSHKPARSTIEVSKLPLWVLVEIEVIAIKSL